MTRLSEIEAAVLARAQFDADLPVIELARALRMKTHTVRYALEKLKNEGVIQPAPVINFSAIGFDIHIVGIDCLPGEGIKGELLLRFIADHELIVWAIEYAERCTVEFAVLSRIHQNFDNS